MDRYHDSACPKSGLDGALIRDAPRSRQNRSAPQRLVRRPHRCQRRRWIVDAGSSPATTPRWTSRHGWLDALASWADSTAGHACLADHHLRPALLLRVAEALADSADHADGRHCAATNATIAAAAQCSVRTVTTVRTVLRAAGYAVEVRRGTGSAATPSARRRPSVWHLVSRAEPVDKPAVCDLPPSLCDGRFSYVPNESPSDRPRPPSNNRPKTGPFTPRAPRPLPVQRLAAQVIAGSVGLGATHPGRICDALTRSGLDLDAWTAPQILQALNHDMRITGRTWPDRIDNPGGFLAMRLKRLPKAPVVHQRSECAPKLTTPELTAPPASAAGRAEAIAYFRTHRLRTRTGHPSSSVDQVEA